MKKVTNYLLMFFMSATVLFVTSCGDGDDPIIGGDDASLTFQVDGVDSTQISREPGETATFTAVIDYGDASPDRLTVLNNGDVIQDYPLTSTPPTVQINYDIPADTTVSAIELTVELREGNDLLDSEDFIVNIIPATVVDIANSNSDFSILVQALSRTGLDDDLEAAGPFTVFAPTNAAFEALLTTLGITEDELLDRTDLADILSYHVIEGEIMAGDLTDGQSETTLQGLDVFVEVADDGAVTVNGATVDPANLIAGNGVVHVIDEVLLPLPNTSTYEAVLIATPTAARTSKTFFSASNGSTYSVEDVINELGGITSADIDFGYYFGATKDASLASPADYPEDVYNLGATGANWGTLNATVFRPVADGFTSESFDAIAVNQSFRLAQEFEVADADGEAQQVNGLEVGDIFAFRTADERYGILRVDAIEPGDESNDSITIAVKVDTAE